MEQPQTIGDEHQPDVEWEPPPALDVKFRYTSGVTTLNKEITYQQAVRELKQFPLDAELGALLRRLPECTALIHTPDHNGPQEWAVIMGDYNKPDYSCYGSTPEEALRNLFQCMAGES